MLTSADVVRHRLVGHIVDAYERWDAGNNAGRPRTGSRAGSAAAPGVRPHRDAGR